MIGARLHELDAADRHQERARAHHDRKRGRRRHPQQVDQDHARRVEADPEHHQRAEGEVSGQPDAELRAGEAERIAAGGKQLQRGHQHQRGGAEQREPHPDLDLASGPVHDDAGAEPGAGHRRDNHQHQRRRLHRHELRVDEGLRDHRQGVADVQRARYQLHRHQPPQLVDGGRGRERPDAERIEEIRDEADDQLQRRRHDEPATNQRDGVEDEHSGEADEQNCFSVHG